MNLKFSFFEKKQTDLTYLCLFFKSSLIKESAGGSDGVEQNQSANSTLLKEASQADLNAISLVDEAETSEENSQLNQSKEPLFTLEIAAIDNGLAFPMKHPDEWRACNHYIT